MGVGNRRLQQHSLLEAPGDDVTCPRSQSLKAEAPRPYARSLLAPKAQLSPSCPRLRRCARSGRKHYAPSRLRCTLGLFFLGERHRGVRETLGHAGAYQVTCLRLQVVRNLTCQGTYAGGPGPGRSPAVPYPSRGLVAYRGALTASERSPEAGSGVGWGEKTAAEPAPSTPAPGGSLQAGAAPGSPQPGPLPGHLCADLGPGRARIQKAIHSGFQTPGPVPGDREGWGEASPPTTPAPPRGGLEHR